MTDKVKIGRADFLHLCPGANRWTGTWEPDNDDCIGLRLGKDWVYVEPPPPSRCLFADEEAYLSRHPEKDLSKPVLTFPCTIKELEEFVEWASLGDLYTKEQLEYLVEKWHAENETPEDFADHLIADGKPREEIAARLKGSYPDLFACKIGLLIGPFNRSMKKKAIEKRGQRIMKKVKADKRLSKLAGF